jgi:hypothetical protein
MAKVKKPPGLIRYRSMSGRPFTMYRVRPLVYLVLGVVCFLILAFSFVHRTAYTVNVLRAKDTPYQVLPQGLVMNHFRAHLINQSSADEEFEISLPEELAAKGVRIEQAIARNKVAPGGSVEAHFFLTFPATLLNAAGEERLGVDVKESNTGLNETRDLIVVGPSVRP